MMTDVAAGLTTAEAAQALRDSGPNELPRRAPDPLTRRAIRQLGEPMSFLLLAAAAIAGLVLRETFDAIAISAIVTANVVIALLQEGKATKALDALRSMETPTATVVRDGTRAVIPARELVPGDLIELSAGDRVPADASIIDCASLEVDESILTGESLPVSKSTGEPLSDPSAGTVSAGTLVVRGSARAGVTATGARTQLGRIAEHLQTPETATPLQRELRRMTARLGVIAVGVAALVFLLTIARLGPDSGGLEVALLSAAALAVAAVPEGLPTVVTVALALGVRRMANEGSIVRRLSAVETLGSTTVILTDKTGTLTQNRMKLDELTDACDALIDPDDLTSPVAQEASIALSLCNDATLAPPTGDPMEIALLEAVGATRAAEARAMHRRVAVIPFDSERKRMTTIHEEGDGLRAICKGAPEVVLDRCARALTADGHIESIAARREAILRTAVRSATHGGRVLALAERTLPRDATLDEGVERDLTFIALVSLRDPVRRSSVDAVSEASAAGIQIVMVTGDHPGTALAIAREVGLAGERDTVVTGEGLRARALGDDPLAVRVYARADPEDKLALAAGLQERGHVVAVTGDGVNDAPALRRADIGVAMGRSGSDVAREAADMVITDDDLGTIVTAVREGRGIYDNIRKVVEYLVAGNLSEILVVVVGLASFPDLGVPLLPLQLLWINLLTDGLPALALAVDPIDHGLMQRPPRARADHLLSRKRMNVLAARAILIAGAAIGSLAFSRFAWNEPWPHARATMFTVLMTAHLLYAFAVRRARGSGRRSVNRSLVAAVCGGLALQVLVVSVPALHRVFGTAYLSPREWVLVVTAGVLPALAIAGIPWLRAGERIGPTEKRRRNR